MSSDDDDKSVQEAENKKQAGKKSSAEVGLPNGNAATQNSTQIQQTKQDAKRVKATAKYLSNIKARKHLLFKPEDMWREEQVNLLSSFFFL